MVSTLLGYRLYASNMSRSLERLEANTVVKREAEYYAAQIGKVATVDDFLNDYRLYSYALKAYGLEDQIASKGLIRKVLESNLGDSTSFANKLADKRYRDFAAAFNFGTDRSSETKVAQSSSQTESLVDSYTERRVRQAVAAAGQTNHYASAIGSVKSVDDILNNTVLFDVVLRSIGADPAQVSKSFARQALTGTFPAGTNVANPKWLTLDEQFNFAQDGSLKAGATAAQDADKANDLIYAFNVATGNNTSSHAAAFNTDYFTKTFGADRSIDASTLVNDKRLFEYVATAFGFDPSVENASYFYNILTSDSASASSAYAQLMTSTTTTQTRKDQFTRLRSVFNFGTDGSAKGGVAQTSAQQKVLTEAYFKNYKVVTEAKDASKTSSFKFLIGNVNSITDLLARNEAFGRDAIDYALQAFDIDPKETDLLQLRRVLLSDVSDPTSYVRKMKDERFVTLAAAFNFDAEGNAAARRTVQSTTAQTTTGRKYLATFGDDLSSARKDVIKADTKSYLTAINNMTSLDDLLDDRKTLDFALKAHGLEGEKLSTDKIRKILTSDLSDRKSFANAADNRSYVEFAKAFNFTPSGTVRLEESGAQAGVARLTTANEYLLQTLEQKASDEGQEGVRLALYFRRKAPTLTSIGAILADKALLETVKTALSLPDGFTQIDAEKQVAILEKQLKLDDLKDAKTLDKFLSRFAGLYDAKNAETAAAASPIVQLVTGGASAPSGILALL